MKRVFCALVSVALLIPATSVAQEKPEITPEMQAEMEAWTKLAQPGEHHEHLKPFVGSWKGEVTMWMEAGADPFVEKSTVQVSWILGGRYLQWQHSGMFSGSPYDGLVLEGYNNGSQRYESAWMDNFGTVILFGTGSCSEEGRSRTMKTSFDDPMTGGSINYRSTYRWIDDDHFLYEAFLDKGDGEFKNVSIHYERQ